MELICCNKVFKNKKSFSNHVRWCEGKIAYKNAGYWGIHGWVRKRKIKPLYCEECNENKAIDLANISGNYLRNVDDYKYLCRSCHKKMDFKGSTRLLLSKNSTYRKRNERGRFA